MQNREGNNEHRQRQHCQLACTAFPMIAFLGGIGSGELAVVMVIVLLIFGPKQLPEMARSMAKALRGIRRATDEIKEEIGLDQIMDGGKVDRRDLDLSKPYRPKTAPPQLPPPLPSAEEEEAESAEEGEAEKEAGGEDDSEVRDERVERQAAEEAYREAAEDEDEPKEEPKEAPKEAPKEEPGEEPEEKTADKPGNESGDGTGDESEDAPAEDPDDSDHRDS